MPFTLDRDMANTFLPWPMLAGLDCGLDRRRRRDPTTPTTRHAAPSLNTTLITLSLSAAALTLGGAELPEPESTLIESLMLQQSDTACTLKLYATTHELHDVGI
jgi:hypothetical protein